MVKVPHWKILRLSLRELYTARRSSLTAHWGCPTASRFILRSCRCPHGCRQEREYDGRPVPGRTIRRASTSTCMRFANSESKTDHLLSHELPARHRYLLGSLEIWRFDASTGAAFRPSAHFNDHAGRALHLGAPGQCACPSLAGCTRPAE